VLVALASNARDAMPTGGLLVIDAANVIIDEDYVAVMAGIQPGRHVQLRISDSGLGMNAELAEQAFEPFFTRKPKGHGSGLGLAIVQAIVSQAGGQVRLHSEPGVGTSVSILLPAADGGEPNLEESTPRRKDRRSGTTVLLVEANQAVRDVISRMLLESGYRVVTAYTGIQALRIARRRGEQIHLLITDIMLPDGLGKELADQIHQIHPTMGMLQRSAYPEQILLASGTIEPGAVVLEEPFSRARLQASIDEALGGS
jgi:CheY-like chemotaxis protein